MRLLSCVFLVCCSLCFSAQLSDSLIIKSSDFLRKLKTGDSVTYYQCHVEEGTQQLSTASGQTLTGKPQKYTITEKYVLKIKDGVYYADYYSSSITIFPNRKFSGLKVREKPYWDFKKEKSFPLTGQDLRVLVSLENKGREATEYDYPITKYTTNQLIIISKNNFKQLVIDGNYVISRLFSK